MPLFPGPLLSKIVVSVKVPFAGLTDLFNIMCKIAINCINVLKHWYYKSVKVFTFVSIH